MAKGNYHKIIIIGCGAAGMMAAIWAAQYEKDIVILERNDVAGKKIPATGNGKCNFTNLNITRSDYYGNNPDEAFSIYERFNNFDTISFFNRLGILKTERNGYCYPHSGMAASVRDALLRKINELEIPVIYNFRVANIEYSDKIYTSTSKNKEQYTSSKLIITAGGQAQGCFGTDGSMYYYLKKLGHSVINVHPALVGLKLQSEYLNKLAGVRHECNVKISASGHEYSEYGEVIFSKNGISGIPVMNLSRNATDEQTGSVKPGISLDFFNGQSNTELCEYVAELIRTNKGTVSELLSGLLNIKLVEVILSELGIKSDEAVSNLDVSFAARFADTAKDFCFEIIGSYGFENAQVTAGGIPLSEINSESLESRITPGLYLAGEILDVDAKCGGYNLQWAWSSGAIAGSFCGGGHFDKNKLC